MLIELKTPGMRHINTVIRPTLLHRFIQIKAALTL